MSVDSAIRWSASASVPLGDEISSFIGAAGRPGVITFSGGFPDPATFPVAELTELADRVLSDPAALQYAATAGLPGLRDWLGQWLGRHDGRRPQESELMVTSGGMEGLALINRCLLDPGDLVVVEAPTFFGAILTARHHLGRVVGSRTDDDGLDVEALSALLDRLGTHPKYVYVVADHQNPTGRSLSTERRHALVELARRRGLLVVEDVAYRELGFGAERRPSLQAIGPDVVVQLGTFSKTFHPGARMGWITGPAALVTRLTRAKQYTDQCAGALGQRLLEEYGRSGGFDRGIAAARAFYRRRGETAVAALAEHLPAGTRFTRPGGGFFSWVTAPPGTDVVALIAPAAAAGVACLPGTPFYADGRGTGELRLAYSSVAEDSIVEGVRRLSRLLAGAVR